MNVMNLKGAATGNQVMLKLQIGLPHARADARVGSECMLVFDPSCIIVPIRLTTPCNARLYYILPESSSENPGSTFILCPLSIELWVTGNVCVELRSNRFRTVP